MSKNQHELTMVARKLLNMKDKRKSNYSADADDFKNTEFHTQVPNKGESPRQSKMKNNKVKEVIVDPPIVNNPKEALPRLRRRNSETFRAQYITPKEVRVCACTWNVGGVLPSDDLDIEEWLDVSEPADIYVICFQEIIPLNAGNIFGVEDSRPVSKWETIIRKTLNRNQPVQTKYKCYSDPPSPSKFEQSEDFPHIEDDVLFDTESDEQELFSANDEADFKEENDELVTVQEVPPTPGASYITSGADISTILDEQLSRHFYHPKTIDTSNCLQTEDSKGSAEASVPLQSSNKLDRLSKKEMAGLSWAEPPLDLLPLCNIDRSSSLRSSKSFKASKSFHAFNYFEPSMNDNATMQSDAASIPKVDLKLSVNQKRRSHYVRIVSKQMVGLFVSIWVRRSLRKRIQNVNVSTVGVGAMGYMGNKGSISVSMSIYQTLFCFICTHLSAGEKEAEATKRNADVRAIHFRTHFNPFSTIPLPIRIHDHEKIFWLGDLNYRLNLTYEETRQLIAKRDWSELVRYDQLVREFKSGRTFDGWSEGTLNFPPTYKYEFNSEKYCGEDPKLGRRTPAWCDRIISCGTGMKLISYKSTDLRISDHRPVTASYMVEVEVFCPKKLQKALSYTAAEFEIDEVVSNIESDGGMSRLLLGQDASDRSGSLDFKV